ncbi:hypothetical protein N665_0930s0004 [Sinapis alba]|nr:hypothetical protein N665_0930s0004 [Sinapis alba]
MSAPVDSNVISFKERATVNQTKPRNDLLVIELTIQNINVARLLVDTGSSANIIFKNTLERIEIDLSEIAENPSPLVGISGEATIALGSINLAVKAGAITKVTEFLVVDRPASYNTIVGTPWVNSMQEVPSTYHMCLKFLTPRGVETIWGNPRVSQVLFAAELKRKNADSEPAPRKKKKLTYDENTQEQDSAELLWQLRKANLLEEKREPTCEPVVSEGLDEAFPKRCVKIVANLREPLRTELIACLKKNLHTFTWAVEDMLGIEISITCHKLNIDPIFKPVKQKRQKLGPKRATAVNDEVEKLLKVGSITDVDTRTGSPTLLWLKRKMGSGEYVSISLISTKPVRKIASPYHKSIDW